MSKEISKGQAERVVERIKASGYGAKYAPPYGGGTPMLMVWEASGAETSLYLVNAAKDRLAAIVDALREEGILPASGAPTGLTISGLVQMAYGTACAAGWHDRQGERLTREHAYFQLAGLTEVKMALGRVVEAIRKPDKYDLQHELQALDSAAARLDRYGPAVIAEAKYGELGMSVQGSPAEMLAWLQLIDSESAEAQEAVIKGDRENFAEELADILIRIGDAVGAINATPGHPLGPIDLEAVIRAKNERNRQRGYRHGGQRA